jgi:hypothetical protein
VVAGIADVAWLDVEDDPVALLESSPVVTVVDVTAAVATGVAVVAGLAVVVAPPERIVNPLTSPTSATRLPASVALRARAAGCRLRGLRFLCVVSMGKTFPHRPCRALSSA